MVYFALINRSQDGFSDPGKNEVGASWNLKGNYNTIKGTFGRIDNEPAGIGTVTITLDGAVYKEYEINKNTLPFEITVDVSGCSIFNITYIGDEGKYGFGDVTIE